MNSRRLLTVWVLVLLVATLWGTTHAQAQTDCPYAKFKLDTEQTVDVNAICNAAQPWSQQGIQIFIFLTDYQPQSEDDWFARLDQAEVEAGLRDPNATDSLNKNTLAFEASTATDLSWAYTLTYGELLYDTPLDKDEAALFRVKNQMRTAIAAGDPTAAFVGALETAYEINYPDSAPTTESTVVPEPTAPPTETDASFPLAQIALIGLGAAGLGIGGYGLTVKVVKPAHERAQARKALQDHLETLQTRTANLLNACYQLLDGETPEDTVLYQLFSSYGGESYKDLHGQVYEGLRRSQSALDDAFDLHQKLIDPAVQATRTLEQQVKDWEMLYLTLVGNSEPVLALSDDELRTLLDPLLSLEREAPDVQLAQQLDELRQELSGGLPLKVELQRVDPAQTDAQGILGYVDQVKSQTARLRAARDQAPQRLDQAREQRQTLEKAVPDPFVMTEKELLTGIDRRLKQAEADLEAGLFLRVLRHTEQIQHDAETVRGLIAAVDAHKQRQAQVTTLTEQGYRPENLETNQQEIETDLQTIRQALAKGDYAAALPWIEEFMTDSERTLADARAWQLLHKQNGQALAQIDQELARVTAYRQKKVAPAWQALQDYAQGNWQDVGAGLNQAQETLAQLRGARREQIEQMNDLQTQQFTQAEQALTQAGADLAQVKGHLEAVVNRLGEVQAAQAHIQEGLRLTTADLQKATALRDKEDVKIGPQVDQQIAQAQMRLDEAQQLAQDQNFIAATAAQTAARELATAAHATASAQVQEINTLQSQMEKLSQTVNREVQQSQAAAQALPAPAQQPGTLKLTRQAATQFSQAKQAHAAASVMEDQALTDALRVAVTAYRDANELATRALKQIAADRQAYDQAFKQAQAARRAARVAIQEAERHVGHRDARGAGRHALERAQRTLAQQSLTQGASQAALIRVLQQAQQARQDAEQAAQQARHQIKATQAEHRRKQQRDHWQRPISIGSAPRPRPSGGSSHRPSSQGSSHRSSSRGTSRRSSSRGSSRRK